jgi:hypothetical protein
MSEVSFPGPGPDGEQPPPGGPARDQTAGLPPAGAPADDWDGDAEMAAYVADLDAGRARIPEEWEVQGPAATISLGDAADVDLAGLARSCPAAPRAATPSTASQAPPPRTAAPAAPTPGSRPRTGTPGRQTPTTATPNTATPPAAHSNT